jgi:hypothetical protein
VENISMYFFNCLQDSLNLMGLILKRITLLENPDCEINVSMRNVHFDTFLNYGEDPLLDIRDKLAENDKIGMEGALKRIWGQVLDPQNDLWY